MTLRGVVRTLANVCAAAFAAFVFALALWTIVPAPVLPLLAFAVIVPELAAWVLGLAAFAGLAALAFARGRARVAALALAGLAAACALVPLVEYPVAGANAERELDAQLGPPATRDAASRPGAVRVDRDLPVVTRDGTRLGLDLYRSDRGGARPTIVTIYGGAWIFGDRRQMERVDRHYASLGYTAIAVDYRHAPASRFPTQIHDVRDALATIAAHARAWNVDRRNCALLGRSAGAELALLAAYAPEPLTVRAALGYYAPSDLRRGYAEPPFPDPAGIRTILRTYIGATPEHDCTAYAAASPVDLVRPGLPPTFLIAGQRDELVAIGFQRELRDALRARGDRVVSIELPWSNHAFDTVPGLGESIATPAADRFLTFALRTNATEADVTVRRARSRG